MELPRIASHTSISPTNIEMLNYNPSRGHSSFGPPLGSAHSPNYPSPPNYDDATATGLGFNEAGAAGLNNNNSNNPSVADSSEMLMLRRSVPSRRPLSSCITEYSTAAPTFTVIPGAGAIFQPSRKREEALALRNLKRRVQQLRLLKDNQREQQELTPEQKEHIQELDNRPQLFQKIISNRPVSMVLDSADLRTAWQDSDFITDCLCWHNVYRQRHSAPPLSMSTQLCHYAQTWANHLAHTNTFYYRNDKDVGQNLFCRPCNVLQTDVSGQEVASYWYMAVKQYDFSKEPDVLHANVNAGHFTQLVWIKSRHFGVGKARSRSGKVIVVANYSPAGNISGAFQDNVLPPVPDYPTLPPPTFRTFSSETTDTESTTSDSTSTR